MKLRSKIFLLFALLTVLSVGFITVYSVMSEREEYIRHEVSTQKQIISLTENIIAAQYYNYINQQVISVIDTKRQLQKNGLFLQHYLTSLTSVKDEQILFYLRQLQQSLRQVGLDLMVTRGQLTVLQPSDNRVLDSVTLNGVSLLTAMSVGNGSIYNSALINLLPPQQPGTALTDTGKTASTVTSRAFISSDRGNYLGYIFRVSPDSPYTVALLQNIDNLIDFYDDSNNSALLSLLRPSFDDLAENYAGEALIIDAGNGRLLLSTNDKPVFDGLTPRIAGDIAAGTLKDVVTYKGRDYLLNYVYYRPLHWYLVTAIDMQHLVQPAFANARTVLLIGAVTLLLSLLVAHLISGGVSRRLSQLSSQARRIAAVKPDDVQALQQISKELPVQGKDEAAELARALSFMSVSLSDNVQQLMQTSQVKNRIQGELNAARTIQEGLLLQTEEFPENPALQHAAYMLPAKEVGGDLYDVIAVDDRHMAYVIGDVSDKGVPAALFMSTTLTLARTCLSLQMNPGETMALLNNRLSERNPNMMFVTLFILVLNTEDGSFTACNAGHCRPVVIPGLPDNATAEEQTQEQYKPYELMEISGPAVGPLPDMEYSTYTGILPHGGTMLLYTDGVNEAQNVKKEFFGTQAVLDLAAEAGREHLNPAEVISLVTDKVGKFRGDYMQTDDITLLCLRRN